jgi:hypothetical protein
MVYRIGEKSMWYKLPVRDITAPLSFPSTVQLFLIFFGRGFKVVTLVRVHSYKYAWFRTPYSLAHVFEDCCGSTFTDHHVIETVCPDRKLPTHQSDYMVP